MGKQLRILFRAWTIDVLAIDEITGCAISGSRKTLTKGHSVGVQNQAYTYVKSLLEEDRDDEYTTVSTYYLGDDTPEILPKKVYLEKLQQK